MIRAITKNELPDCLLVIHESFATVAEEFGLTLENCPGHTSFTKLEKLQSQYDNGWNMFVLYINELLIGFFSLSKAAENEYELHYLAVLPKYKHNGYGKNMLDYAKEKVREWGGSKIKIGIIEDSARIKNWYMSNEFIHTGTHKFDHLPFTVGFLECNV